MDRGEEVLTDREVLTKHGLDYTIDLYARDRIMDNYHPKKLDLVVNEIIDNTKDSKTFRLTRKNGNLPVFESGQYINIFVKIDGVRTSRPYSISSSRRQMSYYEITVSRIKTGFVSDYFLDEVKLGQEFETKSPAGSFKYNPVFHKNNSVFIKQTKNLNYFNKHYPNIKKTYFTQENKNNEIIFLGNKIQNYEVPSLLIIKNNTVNLIELKDIFKSIDKMSYKVYEDLLSL